MRKLYICVLFLAYSLFLSAQTKDLYDMEHIPEIKVNFSQENWDYKLDSLKQLGLDDRLVATHVTINGVRYDSVGIRYKGNSSYFNVKSLSLPKLPFNIKADFVKDGQRFPGGYKTIKLSNVFRDPSFLREVLSYHVANDYMHSPRANFVKLYVNDIYLGLYNNTESVDEKFLKEKFGKDNGTLIKCDPDWHATELLDCPDGDKASLMYLGEDTTCYLAYYELKSDSGWLELIDLTRTLNQAPENIEELLDVDQTLWMLAFNNVLVNLDSYMGRLCHNYYLYKGPTNQFHPIVWDMNLSLGGFRYDGLENQALTDEELKTLSAFTHYKEKNPNRPLITNLLFNSLYRKVYVAHIKTIVDEHFKTGKYMTWATKIQELIDKEVEADENKLYTYLAFKQNLHGTAKAGKSNIIGITELMSARTKYLINHPLYKQKDPRIGDVKHEKKEDKLIIQARIMDTEKGWLVHRKSIKKAFKRVAMNDNGKDGDQTAGDNIWTATIDYKKGLDYYIIGEGKRTAKLSPVRASFEFYEVE